MTFEDRADFKINYEVNKELRKFWYQETISLEDKLRFAKCQSEHYRSLEKKYRDKIIADLPASSPLRFEMLDQGRK